MTTPRTAPAKTGRGLIIGRIAGVEIRLDLSVLVIFGLIVYSLASGVFHAWHEDWGAGLRWACALGAGVLFFVSLLLHELAHTFVARSYGIPVPRITLFLFGGVSEMGEEPPSPRKEFFIAIVGPLTSLFLGLLCSGIAALSVGAQGRAALLDDPTTAIAGFGPLPTLLLWLGPINVILGLFNLVPGFPLDGGRVLRSLLWSLSGSLDKATRWASEAGKVFGWTLMGLGVLQLLGGNLQGLWLILVGWFLQNAARNSYQQLLVRRVLEGHEAGDLMQTRFGSVGPELPLQTFVDEHLLRSNQLWWPVDVEGRTVGLITFDQAREVPEEARADTTVGDVMERVSELCSIPPDLSGRDVLQAVRAEGGAPLPVTRAGQIVGFLRPADIARWLTMHELQAEVS